MDFREFGTRKKENQTLKDMILELDKSLLFKLYVDFIWDAFKFLALVTAMKVYFDSRVDRGMGCFDSLMYSAFIFVVIILALIILAYAIYSLVVIIGSWLDGYFASRRLRKSTQEVKQIIQPELPPINKELLSQYLSAKFKGMGANENYVPQLLKDLEILQKTSPTEVQRFAVMLYESKVLVNKPAQFNEWVKVFFNIVGMEHPKYISRSKHKPTQEMIDHYYYINLP